MTPELQTTVREIKKQFMSLRNGIVADVYRKAGISCYSIIFGLNLPQMASIASTLEKDEALARALWDDRGVRESRLLSTWLWPSEAVTPALLKQLLDEAQTREETDYINLHLKPR